MDLEEMFNLKGKVAVVTGGYGHLGKSFSEALAEFGATVIIASRDQGKCKVLADELSKKYHNVNDAVFLDVANSEIVHDTIQSIHKKYGHIDILVNNAYYKKGREVHSIGDDDWQYTIDGTINSVFRCTKAVLPYMMNQKSGRIINVGSMYGIVSPDFSIYDGNDIFNPASYGAGKAAVIQFTKYICSMYGKYGITCNSISPGPFHNCDAQNDEEFIHRLCMKNPLGRIGKPDDLKGAVVLLASSAGNYICGHNLVVDGGWTIW
jgi:NAD(P)-dependent dehydrogenase (short-subunit alcohol dehydrogenase family)